MFAIEKNHCGIRVTSIADVAAAFVPSLLMYEGRKPEDGPGVWTDSQNNDKERLQSNLNFFLHYDQLAFHDPFITNTRGMQDMLREQLLAFRRKPMPNPHPEFKDTRWVYSGKYKGFKDDVCITLQMACMWGSIFLSEAQYCGAQQVRRFRSIPPVHISDNPRSVRRLTIKTHRISQPFDPRQ